MHQNVIDWLKGNGFNFWDRFVGRAEEVCAITVFYKPDPVKSLLLGRKFQQTTLRSLSKETQKLKSFILKCWRTICTPLNFWFHLYNCCFRLQLWVSLCYVLHPKVCSELHFLSQLQLNSFPLHDANTEQIHLSVSLKFSHTFSTG